MLDQGIDWLMEKVVMRLMGVALIVITFVGAVYVAQVAYGYVTSAHPSTTLDLTEWHCSRSISFESRCGAKITHPCIRSACVAYELQPHPLSSGER